MQLEHHTELQNLKIKHESYLKAAVGEVEFHGAECLHQEARSYKQFKLKEAQTRVSVLQNFWRKNNRSWMTWKGNWRKPVPKLS